MRSLFLVTLALAVLYVLTPCGVAYGAFGELLSKLELTEPEAANGALGDDVDIDSGILAITASGVWEEGARIPGVIVRYDAKTFDELSRIASPDDFPFISTPTGLGGVGKVEIADGRMIGGAFSYGELFECCESWGAAFFWDDLESSPVTLDTARGDPRSTAAGLSVSLDETYAVVGAPGVGNESFPDRTGSAYLYDAATSAYLGELIPEDVRLGDGVGRSVSVDEGLVLLGADHRGRRDTFNDDSQNGAAYMFDAATRQQLFKFEPDEPQLSANFGVSGVLQDGYAIIGAPGRGGAVYLFDVTTGERLRKISVSERQGRGLGSDVAYADGLILAASENRTDGRAYVFDAATGLRLATFATPDSTEEDYFGTAVAIGNGIAVVTAQGTNSFRGAAYVFDVSNPQLPGDFNGDRRIDNADLNLLLGHWGDPAESVSPEWIGRPVEGDTVDNSELGGLLYAWGAGVEHATAVPEPHAVLLAMLMALHSAGLRRRLAILS